MLNGGCLALHGGNKLGIFPDNWHCRNEWTSVCNFAYGGYAHSFNADVTIQWDTLLTPNETGKPDGYPSAWEDGALPILWVANSFYDTGSGDPHLEQFDVALAFIEKTWKNTYGDNAISFKKADNAAASLILPTDAPQLLARSGSLVVWRGVTFPGKDDPDAGGVKQYSLAKFLREATGDDSISGSVVAFAYSKWDIDKFVHIRTNKRTGRSTLYAEMPRDKSMADDKSISGKDPTEENQFESDWDAYAMENCVLQGVSVYGSDIISLGKAWSSAHGFPDGCRCPDIYVPMKVIVIDAKSPHYQVPTDNAYNGHVDGLFDAVLQGKSSSYSEGLPASAPKGTAGAYSLKSSIKELNI